MRSERLSGEHAFDSTTESMHIDRPCIDHRVLGVTSHGASRTTGTTTAGGEMIARFDSDAISRLTDPQRGDAMTNSGIGVAS